MKEKKLKGRCSDRKRNTYENVDQFTVECLENEKEKEKRERLMKIWDRKKYSVNSALLLYSYMDAEK